MPVVAEPCAVQDEWQGETRLRFKLCGLSAPPCARCLYVHAHRMHAAADLGCKESAQRVYELLLRVLAGYGHLSAHGREIFIN